MEVSDGGVVSSALIPRALTAGELVFSGGTIQDLKALPDNVLIGSAPTVVWQTREQARAFHGGDVQSRRAGLLVSPVRVRSREGDPHELVLGATSHPQGPGSIAIPHKRLTTKIGVIGGTALVGPKLVSELLS